MASEPVAVVTGANRGIGLEVVRQLAGLGYGVILASRDEAKGERAAARLGTSGGWVEAHALDVSDAASVVSFGAWLADRHGRCDVLVNNAAIHYDTWQSGVDADLDVVQQALDTNLLGAWRSVQAVAPLLRRSPHPRIVNVSSEGGSITQMTGGTPAYASSKAALNALTRLLAAELRADGVLVNSACPGWTATDMGGRGGRPVAEGAASVVWAATLPDDGPTGGFFRDGHPIPW